MSEQSLVPIACNCKHSDAWRCAVAQVLPTVTCHCACHRERAAAHQAQRIKEITATESSQYAQLMNVIDFSNRFMIAGSLRELAFINPPTRETRMSPQEALVLAAWLVSMAEPFAGVAFADVLEKVQST